jgi:hypothetical protein
MLFWKVTIWRADITHHLRLSHLHVCQPASLFANQLPSPKISNPHVSDALSMFTTILAWQCPQCKVAQHLGR